MMHYGTQKYMIDQAMIRSIKNSAISQARVLPGFGGFSISDRLKGLYNQDESHHKLF